MNGCVFFLCRPDRQLQDIVYKIIPFLEECECSAGGIQAEFAHIQAEFAHITRSFV